MGKDEAVKNSKENNRSEGEPDPRQNEPRQEEPRPERPHVTVHVDEAPITLTPHDFDSAVMEAEILEDRRRRYYESLWFWLLFIPFFLLITISMFWLLLPPDYDYYDGYGYRRRDMVTVRLPDDRGVVAVTPARGAWDSPKVVAILNDAKQNPSQTKQTNPARERTGRIRVISN